LFAQVVEVCRKIWKVVECAVNRGESKPERPGTPFR